MGELEYKEIMWAEMKPDVYDGENCDQITPRWECYADGDMDSDYFDEIKLHSKSFPPGTKISISVPCCPKCGVIQELCKTDEGCDFNWEDWTFNEYS